MKRHWISTLLTISLTLVIATVESSLSPVRASGLESNDVASKATSPNLQATPTPVLFGDFEIATNGFGFQNYGGNFPEGDLTVVEVQEMFGNQVCRRLDGTTCVPTVDAQLWVDSMNQYMEGGHCNGFTVMSHRLFEGEFTPVEFTSQAESVFGVEQTVPVMRRIAQNWTQQITDEILNAEFWGTPHEVIDALLETTELVELKIFFDNVGHSMLAYGLQDMGDGLYRILVYDNNWPGRTDLYVEVDYAANSWRYSLAALNPNEDAEIWTGDDKSWPPNLVFVPLSAYHESLTCPFCSAGATGDANTTNVSLTGAGDFLVRDEQGRYSGIWAGAAIDNIPGSRLRRIVGAPSNKGALVRLPAEEEITVQIGNTSLAQGEPGDLRILSPGFSVALDDLMLTQNRTEELAFSQTAQSVRFSANSVQRPVFKVTIQDEAGADYLFVLAGADFGPDQDLRFNVDQNDGLIVASDSLTADNVTLVMARLGSTGEAIFATDGLAIQGGGKIAMDYSNWNGLAPLDIQVDADGDGVFEQMGALDNVFPQVPVAGAASGDDLITVLNEVAPYMDQTDKAAFLDALRTNPLDGDDTGRLLLALGELNFDDDDLATFFDTSDYSTGELAEAIHEVRRDNNSQAALLDRLALSSDDREAVLDELQSLDEVKKVLVDLDFLDPDPHKRVAAILPFILDRGLSPHQIGNLVERLTAKGTLLAPEADVLVNALELSPDVEAVVRGDLADSNVRNAPTGQVVPTPTSHPTETAPVVDASPTPTVEAIAPTPLPPTPTKSVPVVEASPTPTIEAAAPTPTNTPTPAPVHATAAGVLTFEQFGSWRRGDQPYGTFTQAADPVQEGAYAGKLTYDFSAATPDDDFVIFTQRVAVPGEPKATQAWVYGDGSGHLFNIWIEDANGEVWSVPMGPVAHTGWQQVTGAIDADALWPGGRVYGPDNGAIDYPIRFLGLVVDRTDGPRTGTLTVDNITFGAGDASPATTTPSETANTKVDATDPCTDIPTPAGAEVMVRFVNRSSSVGTLYWIDRDSLEEVEYDRLDPGQTRDQETFVADRWLVKDPSGNTLLEYTASDELTQCVPVR